MIDVVMEGLLIILLAFMPLALGVVHAWSEQIVVILTGLLLLALGLKVFLTKKQSTVWTWAYVPLGLFLLLVVFQRIPIPASWLATLSPHTWELKNHLLRDVPQSPPLLETAALSFYPLATRHAGRLLGVMMVIFVVVVNHYRSPGRIKRLFGAITLIGAIVAALALAQNLFGNGKIYWHIPTWDQKAASGPFINHSHFGQYMNLSIGAALALLFIKLSEYNRGRQLTWPALIARLGQPSLRFVWILSAVIILAGTALLVSLTRGGMISMLLAGALTAGLMATRRHLRQQHWLIILLAVGVFFCLLYVGFEGVYNRLADLRQPTAYTDRFGILKNSAPLVLNFPLWGTGLGSFAYLYPMMDKSVDPRWAVFAENEYLQTLIETGWVGLHLLVFFGLIVAYAFYRCLKQISPPSSANPASSAPALPNAAFGLGFGLLAVLIHSLSDFGQHLPANACLSLIFCGLLINISRFPSTRIGDVAPALNRYRWLGGGLLIPFIIVGWGGLCLSADRARRAESCHHRALALEKRLNKNISSNPEEDYRRLNEMAAGAVHLQPENVRYRYLANAWRWRHLIQWASSSMNKRPSDQTVRDIVSDLHRARQYCPTFGPLYCLAGQLEWIVLADPAGPAHIRRGYRLAPNNPMVCLTAARLDVEQERWSNSLEKFRRYLQLGGSFREVTDLYVEKWDRPELALSLAKDNPRRLIWLSRILRHRPAYRDLSSSLHQQAVALLTDRCARKNASAAELALLAQLFYEQKQYDRSLTYFRRALVLDYGRVQWRFLMAKMLADTDRVPEAMHQARVCLRLQPEMTAARKLLTELSVRPDSSIN